MERIPLQAVTPWTRLSRVLMPDYCARAALYGWIVVPLGALVLLHAAWTVSSLPGPALLQVLACLLLAMVGGSFPILIPRTRLSVALGEFFTVLLLFLHGPAAAVLAAAAEAATVSARHSPRWTSHLGAPAMAALSMAAAGHLITAALGWLAAGSTLPAATLVGAALWFAVLHFLCNTLVVAVLPSLRRGERPPLGAITGSLGFVLAVTALNACGAAWLVGTFHHNAFFVMLAATPALALVLTWLRGYLGQQEAARAFSEAEAERAQREAEITARHLQEMHRIAFHDALTGLPNRRRLLEELGSTIELCRSDARAGYGLMFLDFDRFKLINDTLGHAAGDAFLVQVSQRLVSQVREEDLVARMGGDEFAILLRRKLPYEAVHDLAQRIQEVVCQPYLVSGTELTSSASIGITTSERGYTQPDDALRDADIAMYRAKAAGKARHVLFDARMHDEVARRMRLEGELRRALAEEELQVAYQPVRALRDGELLGFEALVRWSHPEFGPVRPDEFVPIAEEAGLATSLTDFVLASACRQLRQWQARSPRWEGLVMHVNLSDRDLAQRGLAERVSAVLLRTGLRPRGLVLELTEGIIMRRIGSERATLLELRGLGVKLAIDDFGIGYSSLGQLSALPIDSLKIDRTFIAGLGTVAGAAEIVRTVLQLARSLGRSAVAEGVETPAQLAWLKEAGCDAVQGNLLDVALAPQAVDALLESLEPRPRPGSPAQPGETLGLAVH
ncbi:MAG: putative bifunctional diguanylate cyclase/phosphodiesterase [Rubrivivax sp.]